MIADLAAGVCRRLRFSQTSARSRATAGRGRTSRHGLSDPQQGGERAKQAGAIHHRFGIGDGFVLVVDEWESPEHFERFFADPELQAFIASTGAAAAPPEIHFTEATESPDQF
jgi:hypothetical protein